MDDEVYVKIKSSLTAKKMVGALYGNIDVFVSMMVEAIDKGEKTLSLISKNKTKKVKTKKFKKK